MTAVLVTLAAFFGWGAVGLAVLAAIGADTKNVRIALAAPALGSAVTVIPLFMLSNFGVPMHAAGPTTIFALLGAAAITLAVARPRLGLATVPVVGVCLVNLALVGRPMFHFGFRWLANANTDMSFYVLSATSLLNQGLLGHVDAGALAQNHDFSTVGPALHLLGIRVGADITLSAFAATVGRSPAEVYMPMILSLNLCAICGAGSLALQFARKWWAGILAAALLAVSPLAAYGVLQQLLPQVWGLAMAAALVALLMRPELYGKPGPRISEIVPITLLAVGLFAVYVELTPLLALSYAIYVGVLAARGRVTLMPLLRLWLPPIVLTAVVVNTFLPRELGYLTRGIENGVQGVAGVRLFGYALVPSTLPGIVGLQSLFAAPTAPYMEVSIVLAFLLLVFAFVASVVGTFRGSAASVAVLGDFALGALLAIKASDFGLFKLYMYAQPFLAAAVATWFAGLSRRPAIVCAALVLSALIAVQAHAQNEYVAKSRSSIDLRNASEADLLPAFRVLIGESRKPVVPVTENVTLATLEGVSAGHRPLYFVSRNVFRLPWRERQFPVPSSDGGRRITFDQNVGAAKVISRGRCSIILPSGTQLALNRRTFPEGSPDLVALDCAKARNVLVFVVSSLGQPFSIPVHRNAVSFWQLEDDLAFPGRTFSGFGRYALFQILKPSPTVRLALDLSTSSIRNATGSFRLPPASVIGTTRVTFPVAGDGAARVFSPPVRPLLIGGQPYIVLDMGSRGHLPLVHRPGVTGVWGKSVPLDPRSLTSYVRDVSLVSPAQYRRLRPTRAIRTIPADLANSDLEYSGIYEDGWIGKRAYAILSSVGAGTFVVRADVLSRRGQHLDVVINGKTVASRDLRGGILDLRVAVSPSNRRQRVELRWASSRRLGSQDPRQAAARLLLLGFAQSSP